MSERRAWAAVWVAVFLVAGVLALWSASSDRFSRLASEPLVSLASVSIGFSGAGAIAWKAQRRIGVLLLVTGVSTAVALFGYEYGRFALIERAGDLPFGRASAVVGWTLWAPGFGLVVGVLPQIFPNGRLLSRRWLWVVALAGLGVALSVVGSLLASLAASEADLFSSETPSGPAADFVAIADVGRVVLLVCGLAGVVSLFVRFVRADRMVRRQLLWLLVGFAAMVVMLGLVAVVERLWAVLEAAAVLALPASIAIAIRRHRLWDVERIVSRSAIYLGMSALVGAGYLVVVGVGAVVFDDRSSVGAAVIAAVAVAVAFQPARDLIQSRVERLVYGSRRDPSAAMVAMREAVRLGDTRHRLLSSVASTVRDELRLAYAAIVVDGETTAFEAGEPRPGLDLALTVDGERVGSLSVAPHPGDRITSEDRKALEAIASQTALLVLASGLVEQLQASREQLIVTREDERRRLRRDLHDGLGPALAGLALQASAAKELAATHPARAVALLDRISAEANEITADVRRLVQGLRPPALDELGLAGAVEQHASALTARRSRLAISVTVKEPLEGLPAAVEVAAYRIATEALTNVHRHANASRCEVVFRRGELLELDICDDGDGIQATGASGVGLLSMRERVAELNGTLSIDTTAMGTRVMARIPIP